MNHSNGLAISQRLSLLQGFFWSSVNERILRSKVSAGDKWTDKLY